MPPASNDEQFKFLISCIRYSNNGKVDFGEVAKECSIVSKGAAAKRYERMMRAHGIAPNAASIKPAPTRSVKHDSHDFKAPSPLKKRKAADYMIDAAVDDEETFSGIKSENFNGIKSENFVIKGEQVDRKDHLLGLVKEEDVKPMSMSDAANLAQYYDSTAQYGSSTMGGMGHDCVGGEFGGNVACYGASFGDGYSLQDGMFEPYQPYMESRMESLPRCAQQGGHYSMSGFHANIQGRYDSPVILE